MDLSIRIMEAADWTDVRAIDRESYPDPLTLADLEDITRRSAPRYVAVTKKQEIAGFGIAERGEGSNWFLLRLAVAPAHYRRHVGTLLALFMLRELTDDITTRRVHAIAKVGDLVVCKFLESLRFDQTREPVRDGLIEFAYERPADDYPNASIRMLAAAAKRRRS